MYKIGGIFPPCGRPNSGYSMWLNMFPIFVVCGRLCKYDLIISRLVPFMPIFDSLSISLCLCFKNAFTCNLRKCKGWLTLQKQLINERISHGLTVLGNYIYCTGGCKHTSPLLTNTAKTFERPKNTISINLYV